MNQNIFKVNYQQTIAINIPEQCLWFHFGLYIVNFLNKFPAPFPYLLKADLKLNILSI